MHVKHAALLKLKHAALFLIMQLVLGLIKNYNFLNCDWFKKRLFSTNSLVKLLSDSLLSDNSTNQSNSKL